MNNKAQIGIGVLIIAAVAVIMGLVLFQATADNIEAGTQSNGVTSAVNVTYPLGATGVITELTGQELVGTPAVWNATSVTVVPTTNYTIYECVRTSNNLKGICMKSLGGLSAGYNVNVTYDYYYSGYIDDSGSRAIAGIILLLTAIGIAFILVPYLKVE